MTDWQRLAAFSHFKTATAIRDALQSGDIAAATEGIEELIDAMGKSERRALQNHLERLMKHIMKWQVQPGWRSHSWANTIVDAREKIAEIQEDTPSLTDDVVCSLWDRVLTTAHREAQVETGLNSPRPALTWEEVFDTAYTLD